MKMGPIKRRHPDGAVSKLREALEAEKSGLYLGLEGSTLIDLALAAYKRVWKERHATHMAFSEVEREAMKAALRAVIEHLEE